MLLWGIGGVLTRYGTPRIAQHCTQMMGAAASHTHLPLTPFKFPPNAARIQFLHMKNNPRVDVGMVNAAWKWSMLAWNAVPCRKHKWNIEEFTSSILHVLKTAWKPFKPSNVVIYIPESSSGYAVVWVEPVYQHGSRWSIHLVFTWISELGSINGSKTVL